MAILAALRNWRTAISRYMAAARGIDCAPEQVIVVSGSQQGLNLAASALATDRDEKIWVEEPGYPMARAAFEANLLRPFRSRSTMKGSMSAPE